MMPFLDAATQEVRDVVAGNILNAAKTAAGFLGAAALGPIGIVTYGAYEASKAVFPDSGSGSGSGSGNSGADYRPVIVAGMVVFLFALLIWMSPKVLRETSRILGEVRI